ncbi:hypothetical protein V6N12_072058 [Hibiscus sabdariffa]|uniref:Peptidase C1A papain C-terminal domain-containing protein n=1 Tax=Hibiscus sabdariffa TaxID=183260 RepID=A0ABR2FLP1_9ROSI
MARLTLLSPILFLLCFAAAAAAAAPTFEESNPIQMVSDGLRGFESSVLRVIGHTRHAISFARFAYKYFSISSLHNILSLTSVFTGGIAGNRNDTFFLLGMGKQFADLKWEEFRKHRLGAPQNCSATKGNHQLTDVVLPESKDWRESGIVSPVKDQGSCGSCWTFSTTGALEAAYHQAFGKGITLSEQQLVDCAGAFNNFGCNGGLPSQAFEYIKYNGGLDTEEAYPYTEKDGQCKFSSENVGVQVIDSVNITLVSSSSVLLQGSEVELKHAVGLVRPVSVAFEVIDDFRFYKSGVYFNDTCGSAPLDVNHAVLAVGYGVENGVPYWLIKNSWGAEWGDNGYFKMEMGKNMCGVATCASYPVVA